MDKDQKLKVALFRFAVISDFVNGTPMTRSEKRRLMRDKCDRKWIIPYSQKSRISPSTIKRWIKLYQDARGNLKALFPQSRSDQGRCRALDEETCLALMRLRKQIPQAPVVQLIEQMNQQKLVSPGTVLAPTTVYRFLHQHNLMHQTGHKPQDRRKFEAEQPNDLWQSDVMHGPHIQNNHKLCKTYLIAFIDDHSRLITHGHFYWAENLVCYLDAFEKALARRGLPRKLYVDNGPAFRARHLEQITASLGITLIHSKPYKPQGRGKIERFFRTVRSQFLSGFQGQSLWDLNEAFELWVEQNYHQRAHGGTGESPFARFTHNLHCLRNAPPDLSDYFRKIARRRVAKDRTITLDGRLYEAPVELIGKHVELLYHLDNPQQVEVRDSQKSYGLIRPVNLHVNSRVKRDRNHCAQLDNHSSAGSYTTGKLL